MLVQTGLCQTCSETTLLVFPRGGSYTVYILRGDPEENPGLAVPLLGFESGLPNSRAFSFASVSSVLRFPVAENKNKIHVI